MLLQSEDNRQTREHGSGLRAEDLTRVVAICFYGRSGSFLLHSLLDGHPDVVAVPPFLLLQNFFAFWEMFGSLPAGDLVSAFVASHQSWFSANVLRSGPQAPYLGVDGTADIAIDVGVFELALRSQLDGVVRRGEAVTRRRFFQAIHAAYQEAIGRAVHSQSPLIVFSLHTPDREYARTLQDDFPSARFIHVVREPVATFGAHLFHHLYEFPQPPFVDYPLRMLDLCLRSDRVLTSTDRCCAVRFEDLHRQTESTMRRVAAWLGIRWDPVLLTTTYNGVLTSHRKGGRLISGTDPSRAEYRPPSTLHLIDRVILRLILWQNREMWGYDWLGRSSSPRSRPSRSFSRPVRLALTLILYVVIWCPSKFEWLAWKLDRAAARHEAMASGSRRYWPYYAAFRYRMRREIRDRQRRQSIVPLLSLDL